MPKISFEIISVSGGFWTGSGALIDLIKESDDCIIVPTEFTLFTHGQFFDTLDKVLESGNLEQHRSRLENDIYRFTKFNKSEVPKVYSTLRYGLDKLNLYPKSLVVRRAGFGKRFGKAYSQSCEKLSVYLEDVLSNKKSISESKIREILEEIFNTIAEYYTSKNGKDGFKLVFDQMIAPAYINSFNRFMPRAKVLVVDRNWKDQYIEIRNELKRMVNTKIALDVEANGLELESKHLKASEFIIGIRELLLAQKIQLSKMSYVHWLSFEELIGNYEDEVKRVKKFLGIDISNEKRQSRFKPHISKKNIGKWKESPFRDEIEKLEPILEKL
ncbi:hypothetical protein [Balneola vulgaris]|uniref:hypothetical protein n=1 Tax=Balneola vulgaris TaxID=287535 RepID=UPI00036B2D39|nr:hypothetical protein [Balneola vulgaris]